MNVAKVNFIFLMLCFTGLCFGDEDCTWLYKCCEFKTINGEVECETMCEPEIKCEPQKNNVDDQVEIFAGDNNDQGQAEAFSIMSGVCRRGFKTYNGRCRRIINKTKISANEP